MELQVKNNTSILYFGEDVTVKNVEPFKQQILHLIESNTNNLILNLKEVSYLNSAGLGIIADAVVSARKINKELAIVEVGETVKEIFEMVKFSSFIKIFDSEKLAEDFFCSERND